MVTKAIEYTITAKKREFESIKVNSPKDAADFARKFYNDDIFVYESSFILLLNTGNKIIGYAKISQGGMCGTMVDCTIVAKYAIDCMAKGVILVHNHPSGNLSPSPGDIEVYSRLKKGLFFLDITFLDSIILTYDGFCSMKDKGFI